MFCCYILFSETLSRFYTGICQHDLEERIKKHNEHFYSELNFTAKANDWELYSVIECETFSQAVKIEKHIKRMKSSTYIKNLKMYPEISQKLKLKYG